MKYIFRKTDLDERTPRKHAGYFEFINTDTLSSGIYTLHAGQNDPQKPHLFDEIYYVLGGSSLFTVNDQTFSVDQGDVIYVPAYAPHRFHDIDDRLTLLVFFSKAKQDRAH